MRSVLPADRHPPFELRTHRSHDSTGGTSHLAGRPSLTIYSPTERPASSCPLPIPTTTYTTFLWVHHARAAGGGGGRLGRRRRRRRRRLASRRQRRSEVGSGSSVVGPVSSCELRAGAERRTGHVRRSHDGADGAGDVRLDGGDSGDGGG